MRLFRTSLLTLPLLATAVLAAAPPAAAANTSYYVDCSATAAGSGTEASPWNSFTPVNCRTFTSGDRILIRRGTTCAGQQLLPKGSGSGRRATSSTRTARAPNPSSRATVSSTTW